MQERTPHDRSQCPRSRGRCHRRRDGGQDGGRSATRKRPRRQQRARREDEGPWPPARRTGRGAPRAPRCQRRALVPRRPLRFRPRYPQRAPPRIRSWSSRGAQPGKSVRLFRQRARAGPHSRDRRRREPRRRDGGVGGYEPWSRPSGADHEGAVRAGREAALAVWREGYDVGAAQGITMDDVLGVPPDSLVARGPEDRQRADEALEVAMGYAGATKASMLQDLEKGVKTEVDVINGGVVQRGREYGVETPYNERVVDLMHAMERGERRPGRDAFDELTV